MIGFSSVLYYRLLLEPSDHSEAPHQQPHQHLSISQKKRCVKPNYGVIFKVWLYARAVCRTSRRNQVGPNWCEVRCTSKAKIGRAREPLEPFSARVKCSFPPGLDRCEMLITRANRKRVFRRVSPLFYFFSGLESDQVEKRGKRDLKKKFGFH